MRQIIFQYGQTAKEGAPVFYVISKKVRARSFVDDAEGPAECITVQHLYLHLLSVLYPFLSAKLWIVVDNTFATQVQQIYTLCLLQQLCLVMDSQSRESVSRICILHPSGDTSRLIGAVFGQQQGGNIVQPISQRFQLYDSTASLVAEIGDSRQAIPTEDQ